MLRLVLQLGSGGYRLRDLVQYFASTGEVSQVIQGFHSGVSQQSISGLSGSARNLLYATLLEQGFGIVIAAHSMQAAQTIASDLSELLGETDVLVFPEREATHSDLFAFSPELSALRMQALRALQEKTARVLVTTIRGLRQPVVSKDRLLEALIPIELGQTVDLRDMAERLITMGYERVDRVETKGQFSLRGGLIDIYPLAGQPIRVELFDVEVDSIRYFDAETQRSLDKVTKTVIWPAREIVASHAQLMAAADRLQDRLDKFLKKAKSTEMAEKLRAYFSRDIARMQEGIHFPGLLRYERLIDQRQAVLLDHIAHDFIVVYDEPSRLRETMERVSREDAEWVTAALEHGEWLPDLTESVDVERIFSRASSRQLFMSLFARHVAGTPSVRSVNITMHTMQQFHGQLPLLKTEIQRYKKAQNHIVFLAGSVDRAERLERVLEDFSIAAERREHFEPNVSLPQIIIGNLVNGFEIPSGKLVVITENEVFVNKRRARRMHTDVSEAARIKSYQDLHEGDYVVHISHGIGRYMGIETLVVDGTHRDYLHLRYAGNDKLYVPVEQINQVQKYLGSEEREPRVTHLGGSDWARTKSKVQKSVRDIAQDLIKLYAQREATPGHAFRPDTEWQRDFEAMFAYEETPDQLRAIAEIKKDMERARPMDRLLCGDVGYGKTEVALRAASKAVFDGKQVAVLVPTTILAQQHYETFKDRFAGFPVAVEVLSRFRTKKEAAQVIEGSKNGSVDIVIGTHRLLQKGLQFKDLGLLVVDEEQRFGVTHKERLKQIRHNVDCLTLTATPIPRTLHMSMVGVRDLSIIETPPENRFPVQTYVVEYSDVLLKEAIEREIGRGGQVYVLYNQVNGIQSIADRVLRLIPEARVAVGHGQMEEDELEQVMLGFLQGETDVLVSTTIIETGLDIPNVNTLIVFHADRMGLSQLYQLRGRVGRSNRIAYAYFTYQPDKVLSEVAEKRLQAIKEFTELGSGFKIAMRDLAIRGAGNLLGAEQHGFISSVGFDMYSDMLAEAVRELRGEVTEKKPEPNVEVSVEAYIPDEYIADPMQKIEMYKKFVAVSAPPDVDDLHEELEDRFGEVPSSVLNLLSVARIRAYAYLYDLASVVKQNNKMVITFRPEQTASLSGAGLVSLSTLTPRISLSASDGGYAIVLDGRMLNDEQLLALTIKVLEALKKVFQVQEELQNAN